MKIETKYPEDPEHCRASLCTVDLNLTEDTGITVSVFQIVGFQQHASWSDFSPH